MLTPLPLLTTHTRPNDTHPIELAVQGIVGPLLDLLHHGLEALYDSQVALLARVEVMQQKVDDYQNAVLAGGSVAVAPGELQRAQARVAALRRRAARLSAVVRIVQKRVAAGVEGAGR